MSGVVFWGVCELIMILGSLSANGWGCVPLTYPIIVGVWGMSLVSDTIGFSRLTLYIFCPSEGDFVPFIEEWCYKTRSGLVSTEVLVFLGPLS